MKKFLAGVLIGVISVAAVGVIASNIYNAYDADFKVYVDGVEFESDTPIVVAENRTYLPLRDIGEALGVPVNWDEETKTVEVGYTMSKPAPFGVSQVLRIPGVARGWVTIEPVKDVEIVDGKRKIYLPCRMEGFEGYHEFKIILTSDSTGERLEYESVVDFKGLSMVVSEATFFLTEGVTDYKASVIMEGTELWFEIF